MADSVVSIQYLKDLLNSQIHDDEKWAFNAYNIRSAQSLWIFIPLPLVVFMVYCVTLTENLDNTDLGFVWL
ncbi:hypothetical protein Lal_00040925 [Lupinus albus]|nr:hypothetical protein Lal_00040925 [Lupinus albus]